MHQELELLYVGGPNEVIHYYENVKYCGCINSVTAVYTWCGGTIIFVS